MRIYQRAWRGSAVAGTALAVTLGALSLFGGGDAATRNDTPPSGDSAAANSVEVGATQLMAGDESSHAAMPRYPASPSNSSDSAMPTSVIGFGYFDQHSAKSLSNLLDVTPDVVVGTVESAEIWGTRDIPGLLRPAIEEQAATTAYPDWHPKHGRRGPVEPPADDPPNLTIYQFRISEVAVNRGDSLKAGDVIPLAQNGGVKDGVAYVIEGTELLQVGETYLLFISRLGEIEWYGTTAYGQYKLDGQTLIGPKYWTNAGVVKELAGRSVDEVRAMVKAASAD